MGTAHESNTRLACDTGVFGIDGLIPSKHRAGFGLQLVLYEHGKTQDNNFSQ